MQGETALAIEAARAGLELQPSHVALRELLERLYRENRESALSAEQRHLRERLQRASHRSGSSSPAAAKE